MLSVECKVSSLLRNALCVGCVPVARKEFSGANAKIIQAEEPSRDQHLIYHY